MPLPFDATLKDLVQHFLHDYEVQMGLSDVGRRRKGRIEFNYEVVRLWEQPVRRFLRGGLGTLPLAPLCRLRAASSLEAALAPVIGRVVERLEREATPEERAKLLAATYVLA